MSDIDTAVVVDGLKALDPKWPIREADIPRRQLRASSRLRIKLSGLQKQKRDRLATVSLG